jgi:glutamate synthase domain-containing protein 2
MIYSKTFLSLLLTQILFTFLSFYFPSPTVIFFCLLNISLLILAVYDIKQKKHTLWRRYPLFGRLRWIAEELRPKIGQYFVESDLNGTPISREDRSLVYQRSKKELETVPFGTQHNVNEVGHEYLVHSMYPKGKIDISKARVTVGSKLCKIPYSSSIMNVSAMSYGALSAAAVMALNKGAKLGNFYQNTGEGGLSEYHLQGGDLVFQVGTGYFGSGETIDGVRTFNPDRFKENAIRPEVKMIEIKISQGAKPSEGGILPAAKNTEEIARIRGIKPGVNVISPPAHSAFNDPKSLVKFIETLRELSGGKPIGIKMCVGNLKEVEDMIRTFSQSNSYPDFITIDSSDGGTGAAPIEYTNSVGTPLNEALVFVNKTLIKFHIRDEIKIIASGKITNGFDIIKYLCLGADMVNVARAFMLSLGCIQARLCNANTCPTDIAIQKPLSKNMLDPTLKSIRVFNYHNGTIKSVIDLVNSLGVKSLSELNPEMVYRRTAHNKTENFKEIYY